MDIGDCRVAFATEMLSDELNRLITYSSFILCDF